MYISMFLAEIKAKYIKLEMQDKENDKNTI